jgi:hypothetical protein
MGLVWRRVKGGAEVVGPNEHRVIKIDLESSDATNTIKPGSRIYFNGALDWVAEKFAE